MMQAFSCNSSDIEGIDILPRRNVFLSFFQNMRLVLPRQTPMMQRPRRMAGWSWRERRQDPKSSPWRIHPRRRGFSGTVLQGYFYWSGCFRLFDFVKNKLTWKQSNECIWLRNAAIVCTTFVRYNQNVYIYIYTYMYIRVVRINR